MFDISKKIMARLNTMSEYWYTNFSEHLRHIILVILPLLMAVCFTYVEMLSHEMISDHSVTRAVLAMWFCIWWLASTSVTWLFAIIMHDRHEMIQQEKELMKKQTELENKQKELENQSRHDPLTGLSNRRHLDEEMVKIVARADRHEEDVCMFFIDLNHFKKLNDKYGHLVGDIALKHTAKIISKIIRADDLLARWGGDEFVVVLATKDPEKINDLLNRVDKALSSMTIYYSASAENNNTKEINFSATTGMAKCSTKGKTVEDITKELLAKADSVMQHGKTHQFPDSK